MTTLPNFQPSRLVMGEYEAVIEGEVQEKQSQFDSAKNYMELRMTLKNDRDEYFDFVWSFTPKTPVYESLLIILGGKKQLSGVILPPREYIGKKFMATVIERPARNDKSRLVNEITKIMPYEVPTEGEEEIPI